jgi:hypothetical protein
VFAVMCVPSLASAGCALVRALGGHLLVPGARRQAQPWWRQARTHVYIMLFCVI